MTKKMNIVYRLGTKQDIDDICLLIQQAINEMESHGIYQWDDIYPERKDFEEDIEKQTLYLALDTFTENPFAQRLYLHNGYESRGYASWRKGKFDLMEKKL